MWELVKLTPHGRAGFGRPAGQHYPSAYLLPPPSPRARESVRWFLLLGIDFFFYGSINHVFQIELPVIGLWGPTCQHRTPVLARLPSPPFLRLSLCEMVGIAFVPYIAYISSNNYMHRYNIYNFLVAPPRCLSHFSVVIFALFYISLSFTLFFYIIT